MLKMLKPHFENGRCIIPVGLDLSFNNIISHYEVELSIKSEFHITLIGNRLAKEIENKCSSTQKRRLKNYINNIIIKVSTTDKEFFLRKDYGGHIRYSRIVLVDIDNVEKLKKDLSNIIGFEYKIFPHLTTHSFANLKEKASIGVGVRSKEDFELHVWN